MLKKLITFSFLLGLFGFFGAPQATAEDKAYVLVHIQVEDFDRYFADYIPGVVELFGKHGAQVLVATSEPDIVEGELSGNWHVVVEFPSMDAAKAWYADADYMPLRDLRMNELTAGGSLSFVPAFKPHQQLPYGAEVADGQKQQVYIATRDVETAGGHLFNVGFVRMLLKKSLFDVGGNGG